MGSSVPLVTSDAVQLTEEEQRSIRAAIVMSKPLPYIDYMIDHNDVMMMSSTHSDLKLYVMEEIHWEEVDAILSFLAAASDSHIVSYNVHACKPCQHIAYIPLLLYFVLCMKNLTTSPVAE